jgi:two-component system response regulator YesN
MDEKGPHGPAPAQASGDDDRLPDGRRPTVLLADDHVYVLTAIERLLSWSCDVVGTATTGEQLLEAAGRLRPDVIVIDLRLPDMTGIDACRRLRAAAVPGKIILLTAADDPEIRRGAYESGASAFVAKHRAGDELLPAIARLTDASPSGSPHSEPPA